MRLTSHGLIVALVASLCVVACHRKPDPGRQVDIRGSGASFPEPLYRQWIFKYHQQTGNQVTYRAIGSGKGIDAITMDAVDFAGSDSPMTDNELAQAGDILHIPVTLGGVAVVYNFKNAPEDLRVGPETLAGIFMGHITSWNDDRVRADNPGMALPDVPIEVVYRSDRSGTTKLFTEYLSATSSEFRRRYGPYMKVAWPRGQGADGNGGVARQVHETDGAIGYVALNYARGMTLRIAQLRNKVGAWVTPSVDTVTAAAANAADRMPSDLRASIVYPDGAHSYPVAGFSFILVRKDAVHRYKSQAVASFLLWGLTEGQRYAPINHYAELPPAVVAQAKQKIGSMTADGEPLRLAAQ